MAASVIRRAASVIRRVAYYPCSDQGNKVKAFKYEGKYILHFFCWFSLRVFVFVFLVSIYKRPRDIIHR